MVEKYETHKQELTKAGRKRKIDTANDKKQAHLPFGPSGISIERSTNFQVRVDRRILRFVVDGIHPLATVEQHGFRELINGKLVVKA